MSGTIPPFKSNVERSVGYHGTVKPRAWMGLVLVAACTEGPSHEMPDDLFIGAVASADTSGDGVSDLFVASRYVYALDGAIDVDLSADHILRSWTQRGENVGADRLLVVPSATRPLLVTMGMQWQDPNDDSLAFTLVQARRLPDLRQVWEASILGGPEFMWLGLVAHQGRNWLYVGSPSTLARVPLDDLDFSVPLQPVAPPGPAMQWEDPSLATSFGARGLAVVTAEGIRLNADATTLERSAWTLGAATGPGQLQTVRDLDGDGTAEIVGFDIVDSALCAVNLERDTTSCLPVSPTTLSGGSIISTSRGDLLLVRPESAAGTRVNRVDLFRSLALQGSTLQEQSHAVTSFEDNRPYSVVEISRDNLQSSKFLVLHAGGTATCISPGAAGLEGCAD